MQRKLVHVPQLLRFPPRSPGWARRWKSTAIRRGVARTGTALVRELVQVAGGGTDVILLGETFVAMRGSRDDVCGQIEVS